MIAAFCAGVWLGVAFGVLFWNLVAPSWRSDGESYVEETERGWARDNARPLPLPHTPTPAPAQEVA